MQIFDFFDNIFQLEKNESVKASTPLDSYRSHRFGYVITSKEYLPKKVMITPYLHDKRIYLNRLKINTDYFYTSIESSIENGAGSCEISKKQLKNNKFSKQSMKVGQGEIQNDLDPTEVAIEEKSHGHDHSNDFITSIICINMTEHKYYIYT